MTFNTNMTLSAVFVQNDFTEKFSDFSKLDCLLKDQTVLHTFLEIISYKFKNTNYLYQALGHSSFSHEYMTNGSQSYETLEFLGDSVLSLLVIDQLLGTFPELNEGSLSKLRASLVNQESLAKLARSVALEDLILVGKGEFKNDGQKRDSVLSDVFEALLGAIYKDSGIEACAKVFNNIVNHFEKHSNENFYNKDNIVDFDSKTRLQELTMALYKLLPVYKSTLAEDGEFVITVFLDGKQLAQGKNLSKKKGERLLALEILNNLQNTNKLS